MARLATTVYVKDPQTHQWVTCEAGTEPEPRLAALIRNPSAWEDGHVPPAPDTSAPSPADTSPGTEDASAEKKPRARRTKPDAEDAE
ncbi:hypothetical protein [Streptomyces sp. NPDC001404]|uniref:hypothetical protein n=1 Tax=Streptomyces sp. NPDC001404 TaxID=3364571 RepID=UPI0036B2B5B3